MIIKTKVKILFIVIILIISITTFNIRPIYSAIVNKSYVSITSPSAVVLDYSSGRVLYDKNSTDKRSIASLTKIMTSILLVEYCKMDELIEVPAAATWIGGSEVGLKKGDKVTAKSLLYGMLLPSGNDCAYTVAIYLGGSIENFAKMMNEKAQKIGVVNSNFVTPHGLDSDNQYSCALDIANIARYALKNRYINEAVNTNSTQVSFGSFTKTLTNTNALLRTYEQADGMKTGFTNEANRCLAASASKAEFRIIAVVLGAETTEKRFGEAKTLLEKTFQRYQLMDISNYMHWYIKIPVHKGNFDYYEDRIDIDMKMALTQEEYDNIYVKQDVVSTINPPMDRGSKLGQIGMYIEDEKLYEQELYLNSWISKSTIFDYMKDGILHMFDSRNNI